MQTENASIIIPVYNRNQDLFNILEQLKVQDRQDFEVVIVDDGSVPSVSEGISLHGFSFSLRVVRHECQRGIGAARNSGVIYAKCGLLIFVDSDAIILDEHWFDTYMHLYQQAMRLAADEGNEHFVFHSEVKGISKTLIGRVDTYANWLGSCMKTSCIIRDRHVPMIKQTLNRSVFDLVGLFDEKFRISEDIEWCFRALAKQVALVYIPGAPVGHCDRNTFSGVWDHYYQFGRYTPKVRGKHPRAPLSWLYPKTPIVAGFLPLTLLKTAYITLQWFSRSPGVIFFIPGIYLANVASFLGMYKTLRQQRVPKSMEK